MKLRPQLLALPDKQYTPSELTEMAFRRYDLAFKTDETGQPVLLFIGKKDGQGKIKGERFAGSRRATGTIGQNMKKKSYKITFSLQEGYAPGAKFTVSALPNASLKIGSLNACRKRSPSRQGFYNKVHCFFPRTTPSAHRPPLSLPVSFLNQKT